MAAVLPDTPWPAPPEAVGCTDKRGHGDHKVHNGWVWCGRCNTRLWPDPNRKKGRMAADPAYAEHVRRVVATSAPEPRPEQAATVRRLLPPVTP